MFDVSSKKIITNLFVTVVLFISCPLLFGEGEFELPDVDDKYIGTYIPVDIEEEIKKTKDYYGSLYKLGYPNHHDVLFLGKNKCYSDYHFHDGYAINRNDFLKYEFETTSEGIFVYDEKGFKYRQISNFLNEYGYGYSEYDDYVSKIMFDNTYSLKNVKISSGHIELDGIVYEINNDPNFLNIDKNIKYWLWSKTTSHCALIKNGINGELHEGYQGEYKTWFAKEEVKSVYPLMFMDSKESLPYYDDLPKDQYRLLRNLVYARHGYIFKSEDLKAVFNQFTWYKPNPEFSENMLTKEEKEYVNKILKKEAELNKK